MKKYSYIFAALLVGAVACNQEIRPELTPEPETSSVLPAEIFATIDNDDTKAGWEYNSSEKTYTHHWDQGDKIYVGFNSKLGTYSIESAADAQTGRFTKVSEADNLKYTSTTEYVALYYPVSLGSDPLKSDHFYIDFGTGFENNYATYMVARGSDVQKLKFKHVVGWLKLQFLGCKSVSSLTVSSSVNIAGELKIDFDGNTTSYFDYTPIQFNYATPIQLHEETPTPFYIPMIPGDYDGSKMTVTINFSDGTSDTIKPKSFTITRNHVLPKKATTVGPTTSWVNGDRDLRANCYVVDVTKQSGAYKFDARYKGNSSTDEIVGAHHARVLWESKMTPQAPIASGDIVNNVHYYDGNIYFTVSKNAYGNAVIALCDSSDNILWSWHIWSPGHAVTTDVDDFTAKSAGLKFMKYDLGQVDGVTDNLFYQWGRKDPFVRMGYNIAADKKPAFLPASIFTFTNSSASIAASVANPSTGYEHWDSLQDVTLWNENEKTKYDPCPAGWRVQSNTELETVLRKYSFYYYTDDTAKYCIPGSSTPYITGLGDMKIFNSDFYTDFDTDCYWTSYSEDRGMSSSGNKLPNSYYRLMHNTKENKDYFELNNNGTASHFAAVRCMTDK